MANDEVLGPRKTMFVLVIVVGCFAVLWPRILSPLLVGHQREQLQPNQFDRDAGCCDVMFGSELTVLELINEVCSSAVQVNGKLSPVAAAECRKAVNETCGVDIAVFLKQSENIGKNSRILVQTMKSSNSSCLKEHFGVPFVSLGPHPAISSWILQDTIKQERPPIRGAGPHPALRERGRAIPAGAPPASAQVHIQMPPNVRVRNSPLQGYFELDIKPPPIPGMRPPLGSPGGPVPAPKSSMGFVMPIYTICIIVFFVYTISKLFFKRATMPYEPVTPDPQFRRRVFRDDSRSSPDKLGHKERDTIVTAISGLVAEVQQQMEAGYAQNQQRQDVQDNHTRPYTNGTIIHNSGPVHIIASEYNESKDKGSENKESSPDNKEFSHEPNKSKAALEEVNEEPELEQDAEVLVDNTDEKVIAEEKDSTDEKDIAEEKDSTDEKEIAEDKDSVPELKDVPKAEEDSEDREIENEIEGTKEVEADEEEEKEEIEEVVPLKESQEVEETDVCDVIEDTKESTPEEIEANHKESSNLVDLTEPIDVKRNGDIRTNVEDFLKEEAKLVDRIEEDKTKELLEEAIEEDESNDEEEEEVELEKSSVKVVGMEVTAHSADGGAYAPPSPPPPAPAQPPRTPHESPDVKSIYLETAIPQQSRVLVADFAEERPASPVASKHSPMVVSGKMTLSLIQDAPRDTPDRDLDSTVDDYTTASALTQPAEKEGSDSEEEVEEEEIEIEEIEEEVEEEIEEEVEEEEPEVKPAQKQKPKGTE